MIHSTGRQRNGYPDQARSGQDSAGEVSVGGRQCCQARPSIQRRQMAHIKRGSHVTSPSSSTESRIIKRYLIKFLKLKNPAGHPPLSPNFHFWLLFMSVPLPRATGQSYTHIQISNEEKKHPSTPAMPPSTKHAVVSPIVIHRGKKKSITFHSLGLIPETQLTYRTKTGACISR